jgi:hypothetical protein
MCSVDHLKDPSMLGPDQGSAAASRVGIELCARPATTDGSVRALPGWGCDWRWLRAL